MTNLNKVLVALRDHPHKREIEYSLYETWRELPKEERDAASQYYWSHHRNSDWSSWDYKWRYTNEKNETWVIELGVDDEGFFALKNGSTMVRSGAPWAVFHTVYFMWVDEQARLNKVWSELEDSLQKHAFTAGRQTGKQMLWHEAYKKVVKDLQNNERKRVKAEYFQHRLLSVSYVDFDH